MLNKLVAKTLYTSVSLLTVVGLSLANVSPAYYSNINII